MILFVLIILTLQSKSVDEGRNKHPNPDRDNIIIKLLNLKIMAKEKNTSLKQSNCWKSTNRLVFYCDNY